MLRRRRRISEDTQDEEEGRKMAEYIWIEFGVSSLVWLVKCLSKILIMYFFFAVGVAYFDHFILPGPWTEEEFLHLLMCLSQCFFPDSNQSRHVDCVHLIFSVRWNSKVSWSNNFEQRVF